MDADVVREGMSGGGRGASDYSYRSLCHTVHGCILCGLVQRNAVLANSDSMIPCLRSDYRSTSSCGVPALASPMQQYMILRGMRYHVFFCLHNLRALPARHRLFYVGLEYNSAGYALDALEDAAVK